LSAGQARVALPGGDNIGSRKVDMHLRGLEAMGAEVEVAHGYVVAHAELLHGARTVLEFPSVGATENLMCAAVLASWTFGSLPTSLALPPLLLLVVACFVAALGSRAAQLYGAFVVNERHRHRYEFNNAYRQKFEEAGFQFSGTSPDGKLVEIIELKDHPFFVASQFHPEFLSKPNAPHPLFKGFIAAVHQHLHHKPL